MCLRDRLERLVADRAAHLRIVRVAAAKCKIHIGILSARRAGTGLQGRFHFLDEHRPAWVRFQAHEIDEAAPNGQPRQEELTLDQRLFQGGEGQVIFSQGGMEMGQVMRTCEDKKGTFIIL